VIDSNTMETVGLGRYFEDLPLGTRFRTVGRTITESDIVHFIGCTGMVEVLFTNVEYLKHKSTIKQRIAPAVLVYAFSEGLLIQSVLQGTGIAFLGAEWTVHAPVAAGDTVHVEVEVIESRLTSKGKGLVRTRNDVRKQDGTLAMTYTPLRMIERRTSK
jgi:acyl dehydratase